MPQETRYYQRHFQCRMEGQPFPLHRRTHHRSQRRTACVHLYKRQQRDGDDVRNSFLQRVGCNGLLFFAMKRLKNFESILSLQEIFILRKYAPFKASTFRGAYHTVLGFLQFNVCYYRGYANTKKRLFRGCYTCFPSIRAYGFNVFTGISSAKVVANRSRS